MPKLITKIAKGRDTHTHTDTNSRSSPKGLPFQLN